MFKKMWLIFSMMFVGLYASSREELEFEDALNQLIYKIGMNLADQPTINSIDTARDVILHVHNEISEVREIVAMFLSFDQGLMDHKIKDVHQLIDYVLEQHYDLGIAAIVWFATFQDVFIAFKKKHLDQCSYGTWRKDIIYFLTIESEEQLQELGDYTELYDACVLMIEAQMHLEYEFKLYNASNLEIQ